jgi:hypothetical protein
MFSSNSGMWDLCIGSQQKSLLNEEFKTCVYTVDTGMGIGVTNKAVMENVA